MFLASVGKTDYQKRAIQAQKKHKLHKKVLRLEINLGPSYSVFIYCHTRDYKHEPHSLRKNLHLSLVV